MQVAMQLKTPEKNSESAKMDDLQSQIRNFMKLENSWKELHDFENQGPIEYQSSYAHYTKGLEYMKNVQADKAVKISDGFNLQMIQFDADSESNTRRETSFMDKRKSREKSSV